MCFSFCEYTHLRPAQRVYHDKKKKEGIAKMRTIHKFERAGVTNVVHCCSLKQVGRDKAAKPRTNNQRRVSDLIL